MHGLAVDVIATAVLARVEQDEEQARSGLRTLRWSNAGHPPPVLLPPDGRARLLETPPEVLLGLWPDGERKDYTVLLEPGASVVFYTDGLVERRGRALDLGLARLVQVLEGQQDRTAEELCDLLLPAFEDGFAEDDVVLLVLGAWPQDGPPTGAGRLQDIAVGPAHRRLRRSPAGLLPAAATRGRCHEERRFLVVLGRVPQSVVDFIAGLAAACPPTACGMRWSRTF